MKKNQIKTKQSGVALAIGMLLLLVVSAIGITSMKSALLQSKMAGSLQNRSMADAAALSMLIAGERYIYNVTLSSNGTRVVPGSKPFIVEARFDDGAPSEGDSFKEDRDLSGGYAHPDGIDMNHEFFNDELDENPKFLIETVENSASGEDGGDGSGTEYGNTVAETDGGSAGSSGGSEASTGDDENFQSFKVISKATDQTGKLIVGFESIIAAAGG